MAMAFDSSHTTAVKTTAEWIEAAIVDIRRMMLEEDDGSTVSEYNFILDRYLSSATSVFSSRPASPVSVSSLHAIEEEDDDQEDGKGE